MPQGIEIVAHRGASAYAPEHTFEAYDVALEMGADVLELDVRATRDDRLVVLHDRTLERTSGDPRPIREVDLDEIDDRCRPLELEEVLARYGAHTRWLVELKDPHPEMIAGVRRAIVGRGLAGCVTVQSFDHLALRRVARLEPRLEVAPLFCESRTESQILAGIGRASSYASGVGVLHPACTPAVALAARARGLRLRAYTVNEPAEMGRLIAAGASGLITDCPDRARAAVDAGRTLATAA